MIHISAVNNINFKIYTKSNDVMKLIREKFTYEISKYSLKKKWYKKENPTICIIKHNQYIPMGLLDTFTNFLYENQIEYTIDEKLLKINKIKKEVFDKFIENINLPYELRYYQRDAILTALKNKRLLIESKTSSGKSLMAYCIIMFYLSMNKDNKVILVVPSSGLVNQMFSDFCDYSRKNDKIDIQKIFQMVHAGISKKDMEKRCIITTWQSAHKFDESYLNRFGMVIQDEVHLAQSKSNIKLGNALLYCDYRVGMTGTLHDNNVVGNKLKNDTIIGLFGDLYTACSYRDLINMGFITDIKIHRIIFEHGEHDQMDYQEECKCVLGKPNRLKNILKISKNLKGNGLILFRNIKYGKAIKNVIERNTDKKVLYIDGSVKAKHREEIRKYIEQNDDCILVASFGTVSTGFSCKKLHWGMMAESMKSYIIILQSLGRLMRLHDTKQKAIIIDIVDKVDIGSYSGYLFRHGLHRLGYYNAENFEIVSTNINLS